jgi:catechol 2,3-dioxygenase-like lactoylglutathione lyase family enzyme
MITLVVRDYDEAIAFFVDTLGFELIEDTPLGEGKRWVRVRAPGSGAMGGASLLLARAATPEQQARVGNQTGGRVFLFLETDDCRRDYERWRAQGVRFTGAPRKEAYGTVVVFEDLYGNRWDLVQPRSAPEPSERPARPAAVSHAPEVWLRGPLPEYAPQLMPVAHALLQAREDLAQAAAEATEAELWERPGGAAAAGYHLQHLAGSLERLLTYARGEPLSETQRAALAKEGAPGVAGSALVPTVLAQIDQALEQVRRTPVESLGETREVGRARLPSTVLGLLFHAAEHTSRHVGQLITTLKVVRGTKRH